jgi:acyl carrier protein
MVPAEIVVLAFMPLTPRGKIDREALPPPPKPEMARKLNSRAPSEGMERDLARIWQAVLKIPDIGAEDSFHDLGGTSLQAFQIFAKISQELGRDLPPTALMAAPTIATLAAKLTGAAVPEDTSKLVTFRAQGRGSPLFIIHHVFGDVLYARELSRHLKSDRPIYGLRPPPLDGSQPIPRTMEAIAAAYIAEIRRVHPKGPYCLAGYSFGGLMAFEMAQQLSRQGETTSFLGLIDTHGKSAPTNRETLGPRTSRHMRALGRRKVREIADYIRVRVKKNLIYRLAVARLWSLPFLTQGLRRWIARPPPYSIRPDLYSRLSRQASRRYKPQPYAGHIAVISGKGRAEIHRANWQQLAQGGLTVMEVPAGHAEITQPF